MTPAARWIAAAALALPLAARAAGPLDVCNGAPLKYSSNSVVLNYDGGGALGPRTKAQADAIVGAAIALWTNVPTSSLVMSKGAALPVDVTAANYTTYIGSGRFTDGLNPVIYDTDGSIIDLMLGVGNKSSVLGFAGSASFSAPSCRYAEGQAVINGFIGISDATMTVVIAHELGHLVGLDHTQLDNTQSLAQANYPLMYPIAYRTAITLHEDDVASVSALYPDATLGATYGTLTGTLTNAGVAVKGANVWARETATGKVYSAVSDQLMTGTGAFKLLLPAGTYTLSIEAIASDFDGGSSVGPYSETFPTSQSFLPPLWVGGAPMLVAKLGGATATTFPILAGCSATVALTLAGGGTVAGNCAPVVPPPPPTPPPVVPPVTSPGDTDIVYRNFATGQVYRMRMNGLSIASSGMIHTEPDIAWTIVARGDMNGDGYPDLVWRNSATGQVNAQMMGAGGAPTGTVTYVSYEPNPAWKIVAATDLDGDGTDDLVWWNSVTGKVYGMMIGAGTVRQQGEIYTEADTNWRIVATGDFSHGGKANNLVWRHALTGEVYLMSVAVNTLGFGTTGFAMYREPNLAWKIVAAADFNSDGHTDLLWRNDTTGQVYVMILAGGLVMGGAVVHAEPNPAWKIVATSDYNADGRADLLWRNEASGQLYLMLMNELAVVAQGAIYNEPNLQWKVLGPHEFAK